jgi:hypothetical protein
MGHTTKVEFEYVNWSEVMGCGVSQDALPAVEQGGNAPGKQEKENGQVLEVDDALADVSAAPTVAGIHLLDLQYVCATHTYRWCV